MAKKKRSLRQLGDAVGVVENSMATVEAVAVSCLGRVASWLAPVPSAILGGLAIAELFHLDGWVGWLMALVIEMGGMTTSSLWLRAREWNRTKYSKEPEASTRLAFVLMACYYIAVSVMLVATENWLALVFPVLSAVGVLAMNERVMQLEREAAAGKKATTSETSDGEAGSSPQPKKRLRFHCQVCGKGFASQPAVNAHQRIHAGSNGSGTAVELAEAGSEEDSDG